MILTLICYYMCRKFEVAPNEEISEENCEFDVYFNYGKLCVVCGCQIIKTE